MRRQLLTSILAIIVFSVVTGLIYPLVTTGVTQLAFSGAANGSLVTLHGTTVGSALIGQSFSDAQGNPLVRYFQPRPSDAGTGYNAMSSGASNLGPSSSTLLSGIATLAAQYRAFNHLSVSQVIPSDAVTASSSGLDPDITIENADLQAPRVARARHMSLSDVMSLVHQSTSGRQLGILGEPVVNVVTLNLALDRRN